MANIKQELEVLASLTPAQLRAEWRRVFRKDAPPHSSDLMARAISWRLQARAQGDLTRSVRQRLTQLAAQMEKGEDSCVAAAPARPPGSRLLRQWNGRMLEVTILEEGYLFEDRLFNSLSRIAEHVTGTHWSGPRFFDLTPRRKSMRGDQHGAR